MHSMPAHDSTLTRRWLPALRRMASASSNVSRSAVQAQAAQAVRADIADTIAAEGLRSDTQVAVGQRSRDEVRAEAVQASQEAFAASAQANEGLV